MGTESPRLKTEPPLGIAKPPVCKDCTGWSGSIHYAEAILLVFSRDSSYCKEGNTMIKLNRWIEGSLIVKNQCLYQNLILASRAPVAQSVATRAVKPGIRIPARPTFFPTIDKSQCDMRHSSSIDGLSLCGKAASCLGRSLCGVLVWENQEMHE